MKKILVLALLSLLTLSLAACEPANTDNTNANKAVSSSPIAATPAPPSPTPEAVASVKPQLKAGDKVKVTINGSTAGLRSSAWTRRPAK